MKEETVIICESCWEPIEGYDFELDEVTMCEKCFEYHGGFDNKEKISITQPDPNIDIVCQKQFEGN